MTPDREQMLALIAEAKANAELRTRVRDLESLREMWVRDKHLFERTQQANADLRRERDAAQERVDLDVDEFLRIKAEMGDWLVGIIRVDSVQSMAQVIEALCDRAIKAGRQHVPVIDQRDRAEKERDRLKAQVARLTDILKEIHNEDSAVCECRTEDAYVDKCRWCRAEEILGLREAKRE